MSSKREKLTQCSVTAGPASHNRNPILHQWLDFPGKLYLLKKYCCSKLPSLHAPSKHKTFVLHLYNIGPPLSRRCVNFLQFFCVCWG